MDYSPWNSSLLVLIYNREIHHKEQDEQEDELQEAAKPSKKLHLEHGQEKKVNTETNKSAIDVVSVILVFPLIFNEFRLTKILIRSLLL